MQSNVLLLARCLVCLVFKPGCFSALRDLGKTEVYLHLIKSILERDPESQVLLLVPEINLTPQLVGRVKRRFPHEAVAALNSEYTDNQRASAWLGVKEGRSRILVGTRMAIFAEFRKLALILVDE